MHSADRECLQQHNFSIDLIESSNLFIYLLIHSSCLLAVRALHHQHWSLRLLPHCPLTVRSNLDSIHCQLEGFILLFHFRERLHLLMLHLLINLQASPTLVVAISLGPTAWHSFCRTNFQLPVGGINARATSNGIAKKSIM